MTSINDFRSMGYTAEAIANYMTLLGWSVPEGMEERFTLQQAAEVFSFDASTKLEPVSTGTNSIGSMVRCCMP